MNRRTQQLEAAIKRQIGLMLEKGLADPRIKGIVSVTHVRLTEDQKTAVVGVSVMPADKARQTVHALVHAAPHIRHELASLIKVRAVPHIQFKLDQSLKKQAQVLEAINQAMDATPPDSDPHDSSQETAS